MSGKCTAHSPYGCEPCATTSSKNLLTLSKFLLVTDYGSSTPGGFVNDEVVIESRGEVDQVDGFVFDVLSKDLKIIVVVKCVHGGFQFERVSTNILTIIMTKKRGKYQPTKLRSPRAWQPGRGVDQVREVEEFYPKFLLFT